MPSPLFTMPVRLPHAAPFWARVCCALSATAALGSVSAQALAPDWQASPPATAGATGNGGANFALDSANNTYVATYSAGTVLHRYTPAGLRQWSTRLTLPSGAFAPGVCSVVTDPAGNAIVGGMVLAKVGLDGTQLWSQTGLSTSGAACVDQVVVDAAGDVYLLGRNTAGAVELHRHAGTTGALVWSVPLPTDIGPVTGGLRLAGTALLVSAGHDNAATVLRLSTADGALLARRNLAYGGFYSDIAVGPSGEVAVVGGTSINLPTGTINLTVLDSTLASVLLEQRLAAGVGARRVAMDAQRNVYISGVALELNPVPYTFPGGTFTVTGPFTDWMTLKLDALGAQQWTARHSLRNDWNESPHVLRLATDGSVLVAGQAGLPGATHPPQQLSVVKYAAASGAVQGSFNWAPSQAPQDLKTTSDGGFVLMGGQPQPATVQHFAGLAKPAALTLSSASVRGGTRVTATVRLSNASGAVVRLNSSRTSAASVPASVTVPAGATSATFSITTFKVKADTAVSISATANGGVSSVGLTVRR